MSAWHVTCPVCGHRQLVTGDPNAGVTIYCASGHASARMVAVSGERISGDSDGSRGERA